MSFAAGRRSRPSRPWLFFSNRYSLFANRFFRKGGTVDEVGAALKGPFPSDPEACGGRRNVENVVTFDSAQRQFEAEARPIRAEHSHPN